MLKVIRYKLNYAKMAIKYKLFLQKSIKKSYKDSMGKDLNLNNPKTLSEKLNYINLYMQNSNMSKLADKYEVRRFIEEKGYGDILVDLIGVYDRVEEINFDILPSSFVLKCTHGCGYNIICKDKSKLDINDTKKKIKKWMNENYAYYGFERHYEIIKPKIICESYIGELQNGLPIDYKLYCINGKVEVTQCCFDREKSLKLAYYNRLWEKMDYSSREIDNNVNIEKPKKYSDMINIAEDLSKEFKYMRVDFYEINGRIIFGEITFTPAACKLYYLTEMADRILGEKLIL